MTYEAAELASVEALETLYREVPRRALVHVCWALERHLGRLQTGLPPTAIINAWLRDIDSMTGEDWFGGVVELTGDKPLARGIDQSVTSIDFGWRWWRLGGFLAGTRRRLDFDADWWVTADVAFYLGRTASTVSERRARGAMLQPDQTVGRTHMWSPSRIMAWQEPG